MKIVFGKIRRFFDTITPWLVNSLIFGIILLFINLFVLILYELGYDFMGGSFAGVLRIISDIYVDTGISPGSKEYNGQIREALQTLVIFFGVSVPLVALVTAVYQFIRKDKINPIKKHYVRNRDDDLLKMVEYYENAEEVYVFSGDFSWIGKNSKLKNAITRLQKANKIRFFSYKSETQVEQGLDNEEDRKFFRDLYHLFEFNVPAKIKCSWIKRQMDSLLVYKVDASFDGPGVATVNVLTGQGRARYLLDVIEELVRTLPAQQPQTFRERKSAAAALVLVGPIGAGKSTIAISLACRGFKVISSGDRVRQLCKEEGLSVDRKSLQDRGQKLIEDAGEAQFARDLALESLSHQRVIFDGVRHLNVAGELKSTLPHLRIVYIDCDKSRIVKRLERFCGVTGEEYDTWIQHPVEQCVQHLRAIADHVVDNNGDLVNTLKALDDLLKDSGPRGDVRPM